LKEVEEIKIIKVKAGKANKNIDNKGKAIFSHVCI
jgi:hypothetical protein